MILGILAAIVVFAIGKTRGDAVASSCKTAVKSVQLSEEAVKTKTGSYAGSDADLTAAGNKGGLMKAMPVSAADYTIAWTAGAANTYSITLTAAGGSAIPGGVITDATTDAQVATDCTAP